MFKTNSYNVTVYFRNKKPFSFVSKGKTNKEVFERTKQNYPEFKYIQIGRVV